MEFGAFAVSNMGRTNQSVRLWLDIHFRRRWIVFMWRKGQRPYCYSSNDATPPASDNVGRWIFGRSVGVRD